MPELRILQLREVSDLQRMQCPARVPLIYDSIVISQAFRADFMIEEELIVEVKSVDQLTALHHRQMLTYLKLTGLRKGLLLNFNAPRLKDGLKSVVA